MSVHHDDPVVANAQRGLNRWVPFLALAIATAAMGFGIWSKSESSDVAATVEAAGPPCVDLDQGKGVRLSEGCAAMVDNLNIFCARNRRYCIRSQRRAVQIAQTLAAERQIGRRVAEGGGGSDRGNNPGSPVTPSPRDRGGGGNNPDPKPDSPSEPNTGAPDSPSEPDSPSTPTTPDTPTEEVPPTEEPNAGPIIDVPKVVDDVIDAVCEIATPLGPIITTCP